MRFKLDENFGTRTLNVFEEYGHDVQTVRMQGLQGKPDTHLFNVCREECRCIVTLDLDFANVIRFPPLQSSGIVVIRLPHNPSLAVLEQMVRQFLQALTQMSVQQKLWIVERTRIRVHEAESGTR
jgi:predicted nuclease of predicted toxin-antitoxin system